MNDHAGVNARSCLSRRCVVAPSSAEQNKMIGDLMKFGEIGSDNRKKTAKSLAVWQISCNFAPAIRVRYARTMHKHVSLLKN